MTDDPAEATNAGGWLYNPDFPEHWKRCPLYSMAEWVNGLAFRNIQFSTTGMPVIKIAEIKEGITGQTKFTQQTFDDSVHVRAGDLLFSWSGQPETSINAFWWRGPDGWLNQHAFRVTPTDGVQPEFFYYLLRYLRPNFIGVARNKQTTGLGHVTKRDLQTIMVGCPAAQEQRAIAHILGTLDDKIELNRRTSETLEAMARALFKSWFVDFDPVRAKMEKRWQRGQSLPGLPAHLYDLFPDRLVDSEPGEIPEGWKAATLESAAALNPESWTTATRPADINYVDLSGTKWGRVETITHYVKADAPSRAQRVLRPGDTIVGIVRPGNGSYAQIVVDGLTGSTGFAVLRPRVPANAEFIYLAATSRDNIEALASLADGGAYPAVRPDVVLATPVVYPIAAVMESFSRMAQPWMASMAYCECESRTLASLCDTLLPKLISGELRVKDAERLVVEVR